LRWRDAQKAEAIRMISDERLSSVRMSALPSLYDGLLDCSAIDWFRSARLFQIARPGGRCGLSDASRFAAASSGPPQRWAAIFMI